MSLLLSLLVLGQQRPEPDWLPVLDYPKSLKSELTLPRPQHAGETLELRGRVLKRDGRTGAAGVILYFHQTDARGIYPRPAGARPQDWSYWHGIVRGWLKTDAGGGYVLKTTRPAPYPGGTEPAHIHVYGLLPNSREGFYFSDFVFKGDRFLSDDYWARVRRNGLEAYGGVHLKREGDILKGARNLVLPR